MITFLMIPLYTFFIEDPAEYGYYDICLTICMLLVPIVTLQLREGAFRYLLPAEDEDRKKDIISFVFKTIFHSIAFLLAFVLILSMIASVPYIWHSVALLVALAVNDTMCQVARGLGSNKVYVLASIVSSVTIALLSVLFLVVLNWGIDGVFVANICGHTMSIIVVELRLKILRKYVAKSLTNKDLGVELLRYSLPLIPMALCWWITTSSDRFFITHYLGLDSNGVYAIAVRFSAIIHTLALIFYQTWQETSIIQYNNRDRNKFFSSVFVNYTHAIAALLVVYVVILKHCYGWLVSGEYYSSLGLIYPLGLSAVLSALGTSFFDPVYQSAKETNRAMRSIVAMAILNVVLNIILVPVIGVYGAATTSVTCYLVLFIYRAFETRRYFKIDYKYCIIPMLIMALASVPFYISDSVIIDVAYGIVALALLAISFPRSSRVIIANKLRK